jgi:hypothetical protein
MALRVHNLILVVNSRPIDSVRVSRHQVQTFNALEFGQNGRDTINEDLT